MSIEFRAVEPGNTQAPSGSVAFYSTPVRQFGYVDLNEAVAARDALSSCIEEHQRRKQLEADSALDIYDNSGDKLIAWGKSCNVRGRSLQGGTVAGIECGIVHFSLPQLDRLIEKLEAIRAAWAERAAL